MFYNSTDVICLKRRRIRSSRPSPATHSRPGYLRSCLKTIIINPVKYTPFDQGQPSCLEKVFSSGPYTAWQGSQMAIVLYLCSSHSISEPGLDICVWDAFKMIILAPEGDVKDKTRTRHVLSPTYVPQADKHAHKLMLLCAYINHLCQSWNWTQNHEHLQRTKEKIKLKDRELYTSIPIELCSLMLEHERM